MELRSVGDKSAVKFVLVNKVRRDFEFFRVVDSLAVFLVNAHEARDQFNRQIERLLRVIHDWKYTR